ncbi:MAG: Flagellar basal-body rod modification protein FlgD [uncultured Sphingosinicella sp.]|uniref:Basal-body rod modification protein FlgD n=1 Tax=uncultured Sphingosinicella sp. TaxID=478748 RepID=A0A6J4U611_9SPHN|nr:flagellar hook capping FlgD N-terminal domain-containing protein [uncultured Sphingosinicella sp.]CAA9539539.1 MAG: Flagellar basal-body rod modification protein FlgD [uncultured Sphingosinicella sp.]
MTTITNNVASGPAVKTASKPIGAMGQTDFLRLMTTQLTTQDPFNPVDNTQMVAQMAQFSQVAGIAEMNKSLSGIAAALQPGRLTDAASWIGRSMLVESEFATPLRDGAYAGEVTLPKDADQVTVSFVDEKGAVVHSQSLGAQKAGALSFGWDGKDSNGVVKASGPLRMIVNASGASEAITATTATWTGIAGIQSPANGGVTKLVTGLGLLSPEDATRLS